MKKSTLITIIVIAAVGIIVAWVIGCYNAMVTKQENVSNAWGQVQAQYQRRADLVPNLVETVQAYANIERATLTAVTEARAKATQMTINPANVTSEQLEAFEAAQGELGSALSRLMAVSERYPNLQASGHFRQLIDQLEGTENRIVYARSLFNDTAKDYNTTIRRFPGNIVAGMFGFERKAYFEADAGAEKAPQVL